MAYLDGVKFTPTAGGTADFVYSAGVAGYMSPAAAGAQDQATYYYRAESADLTQWEIGVGTWTASSGTLARTTVLFNSSGNTSKINFSAAPYVGLVLAAEGLREKLAASRTYFVNGSTGNDGNSGLTSGAAFATIQKAVDVACSLDLGVFAVTINVAAGTYAQGSSILTLKSYVGVGPITISGDTITPSNVAISGTNAFATITANGVKGTWNIQGVKITAAGHCVDAENGSIVNFSGNVEFGACGASSGHIHLFNGSFCTLFASYIISGGGGYHYVVDTGSIVTDANHTVTLTGTPAFGQQFASASHSAGIYSGGVTFSGSATGTRYLANMNGWIETFGGGANYFPGNVAGSSSTGGQYN